MSLKSYILQRFINLIPVLVISLFLAFSLTRMMPGNPYLIQFANVKPTSENYEIYLQNVERLGLDKPILIQFIMYFETVFGIFFAYLILGIFGLLCLKFFIRIIYNLFSILKKNNQLRNPKKNQLKNPKKKNLPKVSIIP